MQLYSAALISRNHVLLPRVIRTLHLGKTSQRFWGAKLTRMVLGTFAQEPLASFLPFWCNPARGSHRHCPIAVFHRQKLAVARLPTAIRHPMRVGWGGTAGRNKQAPSVDLAIAGSELPRGTQPQRSKCNRKQQHFSFFCEAAARRTTGQTGEVSARRDGTASPESLL